MATPSPRPRYEIAHLDDIPATAYDGSQGFAILGETAGIERCKSRDAYARHNGTAPLPVWSSNRQRHRLSRTGNRQLNAAIHRIALTQARCHPAAQAPMARRRANGDGGLEALRVLKRRLSDVVYQALRADLTTTLAEAA